MRPKEPQLLLVVGLLIYVGVQGYLAVMPLRHWNLTPQVDDSLTYVLKSQQMRECFQQNCPALTDLRDQLFNHGDVAPYSEIYNHKVLVVSRVFPVYHPLFSMLLIGISKLGLQGNLMETYRVLWSLAPLIFGLAFAYWLAVIFNPAVAGVALILLAFKVFPDTGLHHLVPSNLTMALAVVLWARIISCQGWAPWSLVLGSLVLVTLHLIGVVYAAMSVGLALLLADQERRRSLQVATGMVTTCIVAVFLVAYFVKKPDFVLPPLIPHGDQPWWRLLLRGIGQNALQVMVENVRMSEGLWGSPAIFFGAVVLGWGTLEQSSRRVVSRILILYGIVLGGFLFYVSNHPADVLFRLWIPLVVLLFGLVGQAICSAVNRSKAWWQERSQTSYGKVPFDLKRFWPVILLAAFLGYAGQMMASGAEQIQVMASFLREKVPLALFPSQPKELLAHAQPGDRVLYTSITVMDYYLINGAMRLGAVYYNPALQGARTTSRWLTRPDLRFAVAYQPTFYHPSFEGVTEPWWWITMPDFRYSPLNKRRTHGPLAREGKIPANLYRWLEVKATTGEAPRTLRLYLDNPGDDSVIEIEPRNPDNKTLERYRQVLKIPAHWSGWLPVDLTAMPPGAPLRLRFPRETDRFQVAGLTFGEDRLRWPWAQKALLTFQPRYDNTGPITVSFDPKALLPEQLRGRQITVMDDQGSSVLLELQ